MLKHSEEIIKTLNATPVVLKAMVSDVDDKRLRHRPADGEWAIIEVIAHMADTEEHAVARVRRMVAEVSPYLDPFEPEGALAPIGHR